MKTKRRANDRDATTTTRETTTRETSDARRAVNHHHVDDDATTTGTTGTTGTKKRRLGVKNLAQFKNRAFDKPSMFIRQWGWKREMKTDEERFALDYAHAFKDVDGCARELKFKQKKFGPEGFASTVWDSAIVMAKYIEKTYEKFREARSAVELGAGCGLTTAVLAVGLKMETVVSTELEGNLELLNANVGAFENVRCAEMTWGSETDAKNALPSDGEAFDVVVASDCVYHTEAMGDLVKTLEIICDARTRILFSYGRNRQALDIFMDAIAGKFSRVDVSSSELDELYQCTDVSVIELRKL
jgi:predicted nicotinamide N-methyase